MLYLHYPRAIGADHNNFSRVVCRTSFRHSLLLQNGVVWIETIATVRSEGGTWIVTWFHDNIALAFSTRSWATFNTEILILTEKRIERTTMIQPPPTSPSLKARLIFVHIGLASRSRQNMNIKRKTSQSQ